VKKKRFAHFAASPDSSLILCQQHILGRLRTNRATRTIFQAHRMALTSRSWRRRPHFASCHPALASRNIDGPFASPISDFGSSFFFFFHSWRLSGSPCLPLPHLGFAFICPFSSLLIVDGFVSRPLDASWRRVLCLMGAPSPSSVVGSRPSLLTQTPRLSPPRLLLLLRVFSCFLYFLSQSRMWLATTARSTGRRRACIAPCRPCLRRSAILECPRAVCFVSGLTTAVMMGFVDVGVRLLTGRQLVGL